MNLLVVSMASIAVFYAYQYLVDETESDEKYKPGVTFADIAGMEDVKQEMRELIDFFNVDNTKFAEMGARLKRGVLLHGPPGTGKTLIAKAVAGECDANFIYCSASDLMQMYVGSGSSKVKEIFGKANQLKPCIIFIDEIDALGSRTTDKNTVNEAASVEKNTTINQLLAELDGFKDRNRLFVIAATNNVNAVDPSLVRPGRFDKRIITRLPNSEERRSILSLKLKKVQNEISQMMINQIADLKDFNGADLDTIVNEAALASLNKGQVSVDDQTLLEAARSLL